MSWLGHSCKGFPEDYHMAPCTCEHDKSAHKSPQEKWPEDTGCDVRNCPCWAQQGFVKMKGTPTDV